jgi:hypothetical protein
LLVSTCSAHDKWKNVVKNKAATTTRTTTVQLVPLQKHGNVLEKADMKDQTCQRKTDSDHWEGIRVVWATS